MNRNPYPRDSGAQLLHGGQARAGQGGQHRAAGRGAGAQAGSWRPVRIRSISPAPRGGKRAADYGTTLDLQTTVASTISDSRLKRHATAALASPRAYLRCRDPRAADRAAPGAPVLTSRVVR